MDRRDGNTCVISPVGDLDMSASRRLREALRSCWRGPAPRLVVDLSQVDLLDASAVRALVEGHEQMAARGGSLVLLRPSKPAKRVLEASGSLSAFRVSY